MKKIQTRNVFRIVIVGLSIILIILGYTYILQHNYKKTTLDETVDRNKQCADAIHRLVSNKFTRKDFEAINTDEDMNSERYTELQKQLNELRSLNSTRYLYTAKRNAEGKLIYLIDGLDLGADDYAYPGTYIEDEMIPYIDAALSGKTIYSQDIVDTTWGHIFTACYPVMASDGSGEIVGALCMEMDMENTYTYIKNSSNRAIFIAVIAIVVLMVLAVIIYIYLRRQRQSEAMQQKELEKAVKAADAANAAKTTFLFNMSHDIRTPMNAILGFTELAQKDEQLSAKTREYLTKIGISGNKMLSIIDNVLELSRIESGKVSLEEVPAETGSIFDDCIVMTQPEVNRKKLRLTISKDITYPYAYLDTTRITEIILNLISNSIKYTPDGGHIHCSIVQEDCDKEGWIIQKFSVSDNGIGMSDKFQKHIYELFSRERTSTTSGIIGSGLGMGIVKKLVDIMDGTIELTSKVGEGTTFVVGIPCRIASLEETKAKQADNITDDSWLKGLHILLAEDNDLNAEIACTLLSDVGLIVDRAENGVDCIEKLKSKPDNYYALILMDVQMPVLDGYEATKKIRKLDNKNKADIPIIAMTANAFAEDKEKAISVGMNDHIAKPIDMNKVIPAMQKYVR